MKVVRGFKQCFAAMKMFFTFRRLQKRIQRIGLKIFKSNESVYIKQAIRDEQEAFVLVGGLSEWSEHWFSIRFHDTEKMFYFDHSQFHNEASVMLTDKTISSRMFDDTKAYSSKNCVLLSILQPYREVKFQSGLIDFSPIVQEALCKTVSTMLDRLEKVVDNAQSLNKQEQVITNISESDKVMRF